MFQAMENYEDVDDWELSDASDTEEAAALEE
jgi:hypothetical protein